VSCVGRCLRLGHSGEWTRSVVRWRVLSIILGTMTAHVLQRHCQLARLVDEISTSLVATTRQALLGVIYLTDNHPWSLSGTDPVDADMDPSARCMTFSDDVRSNEEWYEATKINLLYDMLKLIIKYIFFSYYMINNTYIGSGPLWPMFILEYDKPSRILKFSL
jgi:hypothetical protein